MKVIYQGPLEAVAVEAAGVTAVQGEAVDVPRDIAESLLEQGWKKASSSRKQKAEKPEAEELSTEESS